MSAFANTLHSSHKLCGVVFMLRIKVRRVWLGVSFSFPAVMALVLLTGGAISSELLTALLCCAVHECGHLFFMLIFRRRPSAVILYGGGIRITPPRGRLDSFGRDLAVLLAGCGMNFLLAGAGALVGGMGFFVQTNLLLGAFNLLPFKYFDGGRALELLADGRDLRWVRCVFILLTAACLILSALGGVVSISFLLTFLFVAAAELVDGEA